MRVWIRDILLGLAVYLTRPGEAGPVAAAESAAEIERLTERSRFEREEMANLRAEVAALNQTVAMRDARIEQLESDAEFLVEWRTRELTRLQLEATIYSAKRASLSSGDQDVGGEIL